MGIFKSKQEKEIEKKLLVNRAISQVKKRIQQLAVQKQSYIEIGKKAVKDGHDAQLKLAVSGLKITIAQEKRATEMLLNFEIMKQMREDSILTSEFLQVMSDLSVDMSKASSNKEFLKTQKDFDKAIQSAKEQTAMIELMLDNNNVEFASTDGSPLEDAELEKMITEQASLDGVDTEQIDKELEELQRKLNK